MPGQSSIRYDLGALTAGISTENMWWGPGIYNSMLMSNNAPGFLHYSINSNRPINTFAGSFQFQLQAGCRKAWDTGPGKQGPDQPDHRPAVQKPGTCHEQAGQIPDQLRKPAL